MNTFFRYFQLQFSGSAETEPTNTKIWSCLMFVFRVKDKNYLILIFYSYFYVLFLWAILMHVCKYAVYAWCLQKGLQIPWNWSYRWLWAIMWVLRIKRVLLPWAASAWNLWPNFLASFWSFKMRIMTAPTPKSISVDSRKWFFDHTQWPITTHYCNCYLLFVSFGLLPF